MFALRLNHRCFHTGLVRFAGVDKASLSKLRKKTGFSFSHCKNALEQFNNDLEQAEAWLRDQAQKEGWARATKLQGRPMSQGLVGILKDARAATMVEVNCETDFVAKNSKFHNLVERLTAVCHENFVNADQGRMELAREAIAGVGAGNGKTVADLVAVEVGNIGENIALRRAVFLSDNNNNDARLDAYVHLAGPPIETNNGCLLGKYGALLTSRQVKCDVTPEISLAEASQLICQHIVGMNPMLIGQPDDESANQEAPGEEPEEKDESEGSEDEEKQKKREPKPEETRLIYQEYLLDPSIKMGNFLKSNSVEVLDFVRYECGEDLEEKS